MIGNSSIFFTIIFFRMVRRNRRWWRPNVHSKRLYSEVLGEMVEMNVSTSALRCIDAAGGLDNYVLQTKDRKLGTGFPQELKSRIQRKLQNGQKKE